MISPPKRTVIFLLAFLVAGCLFEGAPSKYKAPLGDAGEVSVYLQPLAQGSEKLRFSLAQISAVREDGQEFALSLAVNELRGADLTGVQKNLAAGTLPPGSYTGLSIQVSRAFVQTQDGDISLLVPEQPLAVDHGFDVRRKRTAALFLTLQGSKFITAEFRFTPVFSLASPGRGLINLTGFVSNSGSNTLTVFDKKAMRVVDAIATSQGPGGIALDQTRARAYVAAARDDTIEAIDVFKREIINRLKLNFMDRPVELALSPDGRTLVSVNQASNSVSIIDTDSMTEARRIQVGEGPASAVVDPAGLKVYVMNTRSSTISVVDLTQRALAVTVSVEAPPLRGAFNRNGRSLYVISSESPHLMEIDPARLIVRKKIFIGMGAVSLAVDHPTGQIYVGKKIGGDIAVIDPFSSMFVDTLQVDGTAVSLTIDGEERSLLAALADRRKLQKINLISKRPVAELEVGEGAFTVVVMGER